MRLLQATVHRKKNKKNRRRNKNKKKSTVAETAVEGQKQMLQKNEKQLQNSKEQSKTPLESFNKREETQNICKEEQNESLLVKKVLKQAVPAQSLTKRDIAAELPEQIMADRAEKKNESNVKKGGETLGLTNLKTSEQTPSKILNVNTNSIAAALPAAANKSIDSEKSRDQIKAGREAKKLAKQAKKEKMTDDSKMMDFDKPKALKQIDRALVITNTNENSASFTEASTDIPAAKNLNPVIDMNKSRDQIKAEREAKKLMKQVTKTAKQNPAPVVNVNLTQQIGNVKILEAKPSINSQAVAIVEDNKKTTLTKAERRAVQEAQRAAKAQTLQKKITPIASNNVDSNKKTVAPKVAEKTSIPIVKHCIASHSKTHDCKVKLFNHLESARRDVNLFVNNSQIHPIIARLGEQYAKRTVVGSNARCIAFLNALKVVVQDFETPPKKEFSRSLESFIKNCVDYLHKCRPLAVSVRNAYKHIKHILRQLSTDHPESDLKENLCHFIDTYLENQIGKAALAISCSMQEKISDGDVILTFGCSSLINYIFEEAHRRHVNFRVIVVDSRPFCEGQELLRRLCRSEIPCTYVLINAVSFVMPEVTKILLGAHALLSNGYVMARTGTAQVALVARSFNVPVLVCCETHKFSERFQTDAIVYNELGNPDDLVLSEKCCLTNWHTKNKMSPLNLNYDITPPELVTAVVTEVSILPCTSVPVILRIKPTEIGYYN